MRHTVRAVCGLFLGLFVLSVAFAAPAKEGDGDKKKDEPKKEVKQAELKRDPRAPSTRKDLDRPATANTEKMVKAGQVTGRIMAINESKKSIRLQVTVPVVKLNTGALNSIASAQRSLALARSPQSMIRARLSLQRAQQSLYQVQQVKKDLELQTAEDVKVRMREPPAQFDDKGRVKRLTAKERKELKGPDPKLPGYQAEFSDLRQDQIVTVHLIKKKGAPRVRPTRRKTKDADVDLLADYLPQVNLVIIVAEPK